MLSALEAYVGDDWTGDARVKFGAWEAKVVVVIGDLSKHKASQRAALAI